MGASFDEAGLTADLRAAVESLAALLPHASSFGPTVAGAIREACELVESDFGKDEVVLAVLGEPAARRAFLRAVLGEAAVRGPAARRERVTRVRTSESYDYVAHEKSGKAVRFARMMPDRDPAYRHSVERAERGVQAARQARIALEADVVKAREAVRALESELSAFDTELETAVVAFAEASRAEHAARTTLVAIERAAPQVPPIFVGAPPWWALWVWVLRWSLQHKWREPLAAFAQNRSDAEAAARRATDLRNEARAREMARDGLSARRAAHDVLLVNAQATFAKAEVALKAESALAAAEERLESLLGERSRHADERKEEYFSDLREIDAGARGDDVDELEIDYPPTHPGGPPPGIVLVFAPFAAPDADGFVRLETAGKVTPKDEELRATIPRVALVGPEWIGTAAHTLAPFARTKVVVGTRIAMRLRACIDEVGRARADAEIEHQRRLAALEGQRIPHPADFRAKQIARSEPSIQKGANEIVASAREKLREGVEQLAKEWTQRVSSARGPSALEACVRDINQREKMRVLELLEAVSEHVAREMQNVGESLERWALEEVQTNYRTAKKVRAESLSPVASEMTGEDLAAEIAPRVPIPAALARFRTLKVRVGVGSAAALATTAVSAGMVAGAHAWAAIGAGAGLLLGAAASLLTPVKSLRAECIASIRQYAHDVVNLGSNLVESRHADIESGIRAGLDMALEETLERLNDSITRLMNVERKAIESERSTLAKLASTHATLEEHDARLLARIEEATILFGADA